jgi:hypothetical protein
LVGITLPASQDKALAKISREVIVPIADDGYIAHKDKRWRQGL